MTTPEDQNGLREALAKAEAERDAAIEMKAREVISVGLPDNAKWLLASKDLWHARALAAEAELDEERQESARLALAVTEGQAEIARLKERMEAAQAEAKDSQGKLTQFAATTLSNLRSVPHSLLDAQYDADMWFRESERVDAENTRLRAALERIADRDKAGNPALTASAAQAAAWGALATLSPKEQP